MSGNLKFACLLVPLIIIIFIAVITQLVALSPVDLGSSVDVPNSGAVEARTYTVDTNNAMAIVAVIIALSAGAIVGGIHILGSRLGEFSVEVMYKSTAYYALWGIFSALSYASFITIPLLGSILWIILTLVFSVGVFSSIGGS